MRYQEVSETAPQNPSFLPEESSENQITTFDLEAADTNSGILPRSEERERDSEIYNRIATAWANSNPEHSRTMCDITEHLADPNRHEFIIVAYQTIKNYAGTHKPVAPPDTLEKPKPYVLLPGSLFEGRLKEFEDHVLRAPAQRAEIHLLHRRALALKGKFLGTFPEAYLALRFWNVLDANTEFKGAAKAMGDALVAYNSCVRSIITVRIQHATLLEQKAAQRERNRPSA